MFVSSSLIFLSLLLIVTAEVYAYECCGENSFSCSAQSEQLNHLDRLEKAVKEIREMEANKQIARKPFIKMVKILVIFVLGNNGT